MIAKEKRYDRIINDAEQQSTEVERVIQTLESM